MFHVPALIITDGLKPQKINLLTSQPDILATALDLIGVNLTYPILGHSVFSDAKKEVLFMLFNESFALRVKDKAAIIQPNKEPLTFIYKNEHLVATAHDEELEKDALAFVIVMDDMYNKKLFQVAK
jgi:predicted nucleotide-binding protein